MFEQESVGKLTSLSDGQDERARCKQNSSIANHITKPSMILAPYIVWAVDGLLDVFILKMLVKD